MIARTWRGATHAANAERYAKYIHETGVQAYRATPGNQGAYVLYRVDGDRAEFLVISMWDSLEAIKAFAGEDISRAVFYPEDDEFLIARDEYAEHWQTQASA